jgi:hypothetical protein
MAEGFDFDLTTLGEIIVTPDTHEIKTVKDDDLRIQLAYNRIKSVTNEWFMDDIGANLEELIGKHCNADTAEDGKRKIIDSLTFDELWDEDDIFIKAQILNNINITYTIYLRTYQGESEETIITTEIEATLDLIKGVHIRYGWEPRR